MSGKPIEEMSFEEALAEQRLVGHGHVVGIALALGLGPLGVLVGAAFAMAPQRWLLGLVPGRRLYGVRTRRCADFWSFSVPIRARDPRSSSFEGAVDSVPL